ncbi:phycobilisome linker polypeptide [Tolypothrix sp. PCC 7910]|uniref:phycobilisome linker polypeptide n=1 Tax=Tolypothrix sp. PCC 7910 TaxID=2099387 RepID=UPI0014276F9C|nr:phycobilisome linker polypeptide [Tolypothrix sp. PCC 7910]QIR39698.1 phycobilisome linker polypeptide [Tolypothrix sp. PCC 7910]
MLGQTELDGGSTPSSNSRVFRYEVVGLRQTSESDKNQYDIRHSGSVFINVPYNRMNQEMKRISRLGGKIVNIEPLNVAIANPSAVPHRGGGRR